MTWTSLAIIAATFALDLILLAWFWTHRHGE